ncbi:fimbrial protein [Pseudomonas protegens]|uniref:fimbrial protein n=1 Tax=Pseudomonas protegens TaxID=380021 RepID=UPI000F4C6EDD|nr:fimbrial protein [Pseudomonas protegens]
MKKEFKIHFIAFLMLSACGAQQMVNAECKFFDSKQSTQTITYTIPDLSFARNANISTSTPIYSSQPILMPGSASYTCSPGFHGLTNMLGADAAPGAPQPIGNTGLGFKVSIAAGKLFNYPRALNGTSGFNGQSLTLDLYKIGQIADNAEIPAGTVGMYKADSIEIIIFKISNPIKITNATCQIASPPPVNMGKTKITDFPSGQYTLAPPVAFNIPLRNCPPFKAITYRFDPTTAILDNHAGVVALDSTSTAKGVAVQILDNSNNPLPLKTEKKLVANTTAGGDFNIALKAAYIRTESNITAGSANTSLTFTMDYK